MSTNRWVLVHRSADTVISRYRTLEALKEFVGALFNGTHTWEESWYQGIPCSVVVTAQETGYYAYLEREQYQVAGQPVPVVRRPASGSLFAPELDARETDTMLAESGFGEPLSGNRLDAALYELLRERAA